MAKATYVQPGHMIDITAPADLEVGEIGYDSTHDIIFVCADKAPEGKAVAIAIDGVFALPKTSVAISAFDDVYWDDDNEYITNVGEEGSVACGIAVKAALSTDATVNVLINARM